jgi:hypothetical protein
VKRTSDTQLTMGPMGIPREDQKLAPVQATSKVVAPSSMSLEEAHELTGEIIEDVRKESGWTTDEFRRAMGYSEYEWSKVKKGTKPFNLARLRLVSSPVVHAAFVRVWARQFDLQKFLLQQQLEIMGTQALVMEHRRAVARREKTA